MKIKISPFIAKIVLKFLPYGISHRVLIMCRGYGEDDFNFTEIIWEDDKDLEFYDRNNYPEFQLWII